MSAVQLGAMSMPMYFKYKDVLTAGFPHHSQWDSFRKKHPPMPAARWAKIFSPFDALKGFDEAISSKEACYVDREELNDQEISELNRKLIILHNLTVNGKPARMNRITVTIEYFEPCQDPDHPACELGMGKYKKTAGIVLSVNKIDETVSLLTDKGKSVLDFYDIRDITAETSGLFYKPEIDPETGQNAVLM